MKTCIIAEVGSVHDGSFGNAKRLIDVAVDCGVDVVKFQTHIASAETLPDAPTSPYFKGEPRYEYFERTGFRLEQWQGLRVYCGEKGVEFLSSPFSTEAVVLLEKVGVARYKVPSGEVTNLPLLEVIGQTGKPIFLSTGMSSWAELDKAVETILRYHNRLTILQCTSEYPCPYDRVGMNVMLEIKERYKLPVGLSDHTMTSYAAFAAVVSGASVIEKHVTFSRHMYGSDASHSLEPAEFAELVRGIRAIEAVLSNPVDKNNVEGFRMMKEAFEKSVVSVVDIPKGKAITREMIGIKKPGTGLPPRRYKEILGRRALRHISANKVLQEEDVDWS